jgi:hypothetical protein
MIKAVLLITILVNIFQFSSLSFYGKSDGIETWRFIGDEIEKKNMKNS